MGHARFQLLGALLLTFAPHGAVAAQDYPPDISDAVLEVYKTVNGVDLNAWVFFPDGHRRTDSKPAMVFFFGGGWVGGNPAQFERQARALSSRGMVAILADYRVLNRHGARPSSGVEDAKSAVMWVRQHARELGVDPDRIGAAGGSSGGHLAAATATLPGFDGGQEGRSLSAKPNALLLFNPVVVVAPVEGRFDPSARLRERMSGPLLDLSPFHHVGDDAPPTLIVHGTEDDSVPFDTVALYCEHVTRMGGVCEVVPYEGAGHGFFNSSPYYELTLQESIRFLESIDWI